MPLWVRMCADTRLLVCEYAHEDVSWSTNLRGNMSVEIKHTKLRNKLHTHTSSYVKL